MNGQYSVFSIVELESLVRLISAITAIAVILTSIIGGGIAFALSLVYLLLWFSKARPILEPIQFVFRQRSRFSLTRQSIYWIALFSRNSISVECNKIRKRILFFLALSIFLVVTGRLLTIALTEFRDQPVTEIDTLPRRVGWTNSHWDGQRN